MNGVKMEIDDPPQSAGAGLTCCLIDNGMRCHRPTGNASYSKRIAKTVAQRRLKLVVDQSVSACDAFVHVSFIRSSDFYSRCNCTDIGDSKSGADLRFYKDGCPIHLKGAPEVECQSHQGGWAWGVGCPPLFVVLISKWCIFMHSLWYLLTLFFSKKGGCPDTLDPPL